MCVCHRVGIGGRSDFSFLVKPSQKVEDQSTRASSLRTCSRDDMSPAAQSATAALFAAVAAATGKLYAEPEEVKDVLQLQLGKPRAARWTSQCWGLNLGERPEGESGGIGVAPPNVHKPISLRLFRGHQAVATFSGSFHGAHACRGGLFDASAEHTYIQTDRHSYIHPYIHTSMHEMILKMVAAGTDIFCLNCSHRRGGDFERVYPLIRKAAEALGRKVECLGELRGPKFRVGELAADPIELKNGDILEFGICKDDNDNIREGRITMKPTIEQKALIAACNPGIDLFLLLGDAAPAIRGQPQSPRGGKVERHRVEGESC
eukprot:s734_g6.t2